jgi:hypothetical protein
MRRSADALNKPTYAEDKDPASCAVRTTRPRPACIWPAGAEKKES